MSAETIAPLPAACMQTLGEAGHPPLWNLESPQLSPRSVPCSGRSQIPQHREIIPPSHPVPSTLPGSCQLPSLEAAHPSRPAPSGPIRGRGTDARCEGHARTSHRPSPAARVGCCPIAGLGQTCWPAAARWCRRRLDKLLPPVASVLRMYAHLPTQCWEQVFQG